MTKREVPVLGISFEYPKEEWKMSLETNRVSDVSPYKNAHGYYAAITNDRYPGISSVFIYRKDFDHHLTYEEIVQDFAHYSKQATTPREIEYRPAVHEMKILEQGPTTYIGREAFTATYTAIGWSKHLKGILISFARGNSVWTIKYRAEADIFERDFPVYEHIRDSFRFTGAEPEESTIESADPQKRVDSLFSDVPSLHPNTKAIAHLRDIGVIGGYTDGTFRPGKTINRAEFVKIITSEPLVDAETLETCLYKNVDVFAKTAFFSDVPQDSWFARHVCVAKLKGMIGGYPDGTFRPDQNISFVEAAKVIASFFGDEFESDAVWYRPFVRMLGRRRAIPTSIARLSAPITRGEMSEMIWRLKEEVEGESLELEELEARN